ncbi:hypothetical protein, conserved [Eimeria tenella]|uniref:Uncharacterized protein n=1 Tax=Eimeria tenella TaxID=5802 RepID=U6KSK5_EIMTE|nr:hypothetical protein, conserved [Eimeria tenella]CDJ39369.1 hypothetical protein, conserved [Eimeria tenella]|eukprot:XP_013230124.1 hypothetical protein, conserved [Eimeria tenella]
MEQCRGVQVAASIRCGDFDTTPRADLKRRLRALLRQEKLYTRSVYLQRQLLQSPQNKRRGTMECRNGMQGSRAIYSFRCRHGRTRQETVDVRIVTNPSDPVKLPCAQSSVGHRIRPSAGLREVQRNLAEGSGADDRGQCTSSVISVDMGSRIHERKSRFRANALTVKPELTAFGTVPSNCIGISDRSEICSGCTSRHRSVDTRAGEQALWDVSVVSSRDEENTLKVRAKRAKDNVPSCDGEHDCTGRKCIELHSICRDEFTEDSHKNGSVKPLSAACTANTATGNIQQERHTQEPFAFWGDVSSLRHLSGHCALTSKTQLKGQPRKAGALSLEQSPGRQEGSLCTTSEACSDAVQRPTMGGWPECVVSMLGPDIFNRLKEEP